MPSEAQFGAVAQASDCSIYRTLALRSQREIREARQRIAQHRELLRHRRLGLESCARQRGIEALGNGQDEVLAAELCPEQYRSWLAPGYRILAVQQDLSAEQDRLRQLVTQLRLHCGELPAPNAAPAGLSW
jgi:hypothetical protein